jgi:hypothetical protein
MVVAERVGAQSGAAAGQMVALDTMGVWPLFKTLLRRAYEDGKAYLRINLANRDLMQYASRLAAVVKGVFTIDIMAIYNQALAEQHALNVAHIMSMPLALLEVVTRGNKQRDVALKLYPYFPYAEDLGDTSQAAITEVWFQFIPRLDTPERPHINEYFDPAHAREILRALKTTGPDGKDRMRLTVEPGNVIKFDRKPVENIPAAAKGYLAALIAGAVPQESGRI